MLNGLIAQERPTSASKKREGELYKVLHIAGKTFPLYYGYYEEYEKTVPSAEPMPIYPDFRKNPVYTDTGYAFVTMMQDACSLYKGSASQCKECAECIYYNHGDELIGICTHPENVALIKEEL